MTIKHVYASSGRELDLGTDYIILYNSNKATDAGTYTLTIQGRDDFTGTATATWTIDKATLTENNRDTFFDTTAAQKVYDGTAYDGALYTVKSTFAGELYDNVLTVWYRANGGEWTQTAPINAGTYDIGVTLTETANFKAVTEPVAVGTLTINPATPAVTVTSDQNENKSTYEDEVTFIVTADKAGDSATVPTGTVTLKSGETELDTAILENGTATIKTAALTVGSHTITAAYTPADGETNYQEHTSAGLSFDVEKKALTFAVSGTDQVYDSSAKGVSIDSTNSKLTADDFTIQYYEVYENGNTLERTNAVTPIGQGKYLYVIDFKEADTGDNYTLPEYTVPSDTSTELPTELDSYNGRIGFMTITSGQTSQQEPIYFASSQVTKYVTDGSYTAGENLLTNPNDGSTVTYTSSNQAVAKVNEATGDVTIVGAGTTTIRAESTKEGTTPVYATYTLDVVKKPITVTANDKTITYGAEHGYTSGDVTVSESGVSLEGLSFTTRYTAGSNVGTYEVTPGGLTSDRYDITFVPGILTVNEKVLTAASFTVTAADKTYDGTKDAVVRQDALVNGDSLTVTAQGSYASADAGTRSVTYTITGLTGARAANYKLDGSVTGTVEAETGISKATVTVICPAVITLTYTGQPQSVTLSAMAGVLPFDSSRYTVYYTPTAGGEKTAEPTQVGEYTVSMELNSEADRNNYQVAAFTAKLVITTASQDVFYISGVPTAVYYGDRFTLSAAGAQGDVTWSVQGPAKVDNGAVTITGTGTVTVTAVSDKEGYDTRTATATFSAEKRILAAATADEKTYDGTTAVTVTYTLTDVKGGHTVPESVQVSAGEIPHTADASAGSGKIVYINGLTLTGTDAENYTLQTGSITTTVDITKRAITGFTFTAADKIYDGRVDAEVTNIALTGVLDADKSGVALTGSAAFDTPDAGTDKTVTYTAAGLTGSKAGNYVLTASSAAATASITAMPVTFTVGATTFAYDGSEKPVAVSAYDANGAVFTGFTVLYDGKADVPADAGAYEVTVELADKTNYTVSSFPATTLTITAVSQDQLTIVGQFGSPEYGTSFDLQALGGSGSGTITWESSSSAVTVTADQSDSTKAAVQINGAVGEAVTITATKAGDGNHEAKSASVVFMPVARSVQFTITGTTRTYDGSAKAVTVTPVGVAGLELGTDYTVTYDGSTVAPADAGTYAVTVTGIGNYTGTAYGKLTIEKAALTGLGVSLDGWTYGEQGSEPGYTGDKPAGVDVSYSYSTADGRKPVNAGSYTVYATFTGDNYESLTASHEFTIARKTLTAKAVDAQRDYGQANPIFGVEITGFVSGEDQSVLWQLPVASCAADAVSPAGEYPITVTGGSAQNYTFAYVSGVLTVRAASGGSFYIDGVSSAQVGDQFTLRAFYGAAQPAVKWSSSNPAIASIDETTGQVTAHKAGDVTITATLADDNYSAEPAAFTLHITKRSVTLRVSGTVLAYNGQTQGVTITTDDPALDEALQGAIQVDYTLTTDPAVTEPRDVGIYSVNYFIDHDSYTGSGSTTLYINKADVELKAADTGKVYGDANPAYTITGLLGEDASDEAYLAKVNEMFTFTCAADAAGVKAPVGAYDITLALKDGRSLTEDANYNFTISEVPGQLTVNARPITVTAKDQTIAWSKEIAQGVDQVTVSGLNEGAQLSAAALTANGTEVGSSTITPADARIIWDGADVTGNYAVSYVDGGLTITRLPVTVTGSGRPGSLTVSFNEAVPGAVFTVKDGEDGDVAVTAAPSSDNRTYTLSGTFDSGKTYTVTVTADAGRYDLTGSPVEITVTSASKHSVTVKDSVSGAVTVDPKSAEAGDTVTLTVQPDAGYVLDTITVTDENGNVVEVTPEEDGTYTFTMPGSEVTVKATFRAETPVSPLPFTDVASEAWYADAVNWAAANGIVSGYGGGRFGPEDSITREQMALILYNYAKLKGYDLTAEASLTGYNDNAQVSAWAEEAMTWAVSRKLISGKGGSLLDPTGSATRAEVAQILMNFYEKVVK